MLCTAGFLSKVLLLSFSVMIWDRVKVKCSCYMWGLKPEAFKLSVRVIVRISFRTLGYSTYSHDLHLLSVRYICSIDLHVEVSET